MEKILTHRSDESHWHFPQNSLFFIATPKNIVVFAFTYALESFALFFIDFCMDVYSIDSDEALNAS
jgi:hypothetical protein